MHCTYMLQEILEEEAVIRRCLEENKPALETLSTRFRQTTPSSIVFSARGSSLHAAHLGKYLSEEYLGLPASLAEPSVVTMYHGRLNLGRSLVAGISQSGEGLDVCAVVERGNQTGGLTLAVTNTDSSRLAHSGDCCLRCLAGEEKSVSATKSFAAQIALLTAAIAVLSGSEELCNTVHQLPDAVGAGLALQGEIADIAQPYQNITDCVVLARGNAYPIAREWALKLQETCKIRAHAYPASNFLHGPVAMLGPKTPVFLLALDKRTDSDMLHLAGRAHQAGSPVLVVTNKPNLGQDAGAPAILLPEWCEGLLGAAAAIPIIQLFSCGLSLSKGFNPDVPPGLSKVTVTK